MTPPGTTVRARLVSASAGSGKTHRLARELEQALTRAVDPVPPEAVLATTFTNKAAAELQERARLHLVRAGRLDDAQRLAAARIGTVNAVCGRLVADFAFELGLPPDQHVLDEGLAKAALRRALSTVRTPQESIEIAELERRLSYFSISAAVHEVIALARANGIAPGDFAACAARSTEEAIALLDPPEEDGAAIERELEAALAAVVQWVRDGRDGTQAGRELAARADKVLARLRRGFDIAWDEWAALATAPDRMSRRWSQDVAQRLADAAGRYLAHPQLHRDVARALALTFDLARRGAETYAAQKRAAGAIDFVDQEALAYALLQRPEAVERLRDELRLVLVDEFQDTSPLQLAIFTRLAALAPESLWVGDQKQSIFGFRGADAELMDATLHGLLGDASPETLGTSYRSRPELVRRTSDLFAEAFARHGIPADRVRLAPPDGEEPEGLGVIAERWRIESKNLREDPAALAVLVRELLDDATVTVRDRASGRVRRVRAGDVAVLCRRRATSRAVAAALARHGIRAALPRAGVLGTAEGQLALAGLRLWADPQDRLAAATVARLAELPPDGDAWLETALAAPRAARFFELPRVRRLLAARAAAPYAGPLQALSATVEALGLIDLCADWGDTDVRLANLDALRAHAVQFCETAATEGTGATAAGLVEELLARAADGADDQAVLAAEDAVTVSTWHAAKGLEWPIVVLFQIDKSDERESAFGVTVDRDGGPLDVAAPLAGRYLRCWPQLFQGNRTKTRVHQRLADHPVAARRRDRQNRELLRLLYVGWTRARDRVILAGRRRDLDKGILGLLRDAAGDALLDDPPQGDARWAGTAVPLRHRLASPVFPARPPAAPGSTWLARGPRPHPPAVSMPSAATEAAGLLRVETLGPRLPLRGAWDERALGEAIHRVFAADTPDLPAAAREALARDRLAAWGLRDVLEPAALVAAADRLRGLLEARYPAARWRTEWPLRQRLAGGTELRGNADLVLEAAGGLVLVDHKTFPGEGDAAIAHALSFGGQLRAYAEALTAATGHPVLARLVHLPVAGLLVELAPPPARA